MTTFGMRFAEVSGCSSLSMMRTFPFSHGNPNHGVPVATESARSVTSHDFPVFGGAMMFIVSPLRRKPCISTGFIFGYLSTSSPRGRNFGAPFCASACPCLPADAASPLKSTGFSGMHCP